MGVRKREGWHSGVERWNESTESGRTTEEQNRKQYQPYFFPLLHL
jgi:hypothetical protein